MSRSVSKPLSVLRKRAEFLAAAQGKKCVMPGLILQLGAMPNKEDTGIRYGLTASSKVGNAVIRNRARRRLRGRPRLSSSAIRCGRELQGSRRLEAERTQRCADARTLVEDFQRRGAG